MSIFSKSSKFVRYDGLVYPKEVQNGYFLVIFQFTKANKI